MTEPNVRQILEGIWAIESAKIIATLTRLVRTIDLAEDFAQDALTAALKSWPETGVPSNPAAWLTKTAKNRAIDYLRREKQRKNKYEQLGWELNQQSLLIWDEIDEPIQDDLLRLLFMTCHPVLTKEARVALTLRLLAGLSTEEIARAFLTSQSTVAQRIVRAKRKLATDQVPFELPDKETLIDRLASVLEVIYLMFNEGYSASAGITLTRPVLCHEALRLGRILAELIPDRSEIHGLVGLMEIQTSRLKARINTAGEAILLKDQNRARWDYLHIRRGLTAINRAEQLKQPYGSYLIQALIAACHAKARIVEETDWIKISALYAALIQVEPSPVIELNRAVALSMAFGPEAGLVVVDALNQEPSLKNYYLLPSVHADLLLKVGRHEEAADKFNQAAMLTDNEQERALLLKRSHECKINEANFERS
ncbi:RNA polymerase sigma factor, sigma-70 family [Amphibacillus marinus]|uniref:RNA polymerase sigma factor, sigma-70 family n=1 Tax=Amphibacillus marinus TaxID=872970 RepID=A0A1H8RI20_9BACI|nr:RNA polymerase sigma factor [Amphibacillus marinus]SEO66060.1 RNA polymerase sigma factor, sigma-70 family [Amphibacillus marinus]